MAQNEQKKPFDKNKDQNRTPDSKDRKASNDKDTPQKGKNQSSDVSSQERKSR